jgi:hypothetical protein
MAEETKMQIRASGFTWDCMLVDDGTLDTVIEVQPITPKYKSAHHIEHYKSQTMRFSQEYGSQIRTNKGRVIASALRLLFKESIDAYDAESLPGEQL